MFSCTTRASVCDATCSDCPKRKRRLMKVVFLDTGLQDEHIDRTRRLFEIKDAQLRFVL